MCTKSFNDMIYNFWDMECGRLQLLIMNHFLPFCWRYHHFTNVYQKPQSYEVWFLTYRVRQIFFVILGHFLPFYPNNSPENQNLEKMKKESGDVTILHMCTTNHNHLMYASWVRSATNIFFFILGHFLT